METVPFATWDEANQRFRSPLCCPEPACGEEVVATAAPPAFPIADRCPRCGRPFERAPIRSEASAAPMEVTRRLNAGFCTTTGQELTQPSPLDWGEAGGGPGRTGCLPDPRGAFFGRPNANIAINARQSWSEHGVFGPDRDGADPVRSVIVVRGRLIVTSAGGRTAVLRTEDGSSVLPRGECLEWPDGTADATNEDRSVSHTVAVRAGHLCIGAGHQFVVRDIREYLGRPSALGRSVGWMDASEGRRFFGPPLGIDAERPLFAVLEGVEDGVRDADGGIREPVIRIMDGTGAEVSRIGAPGISRPPVYDRLNQVLIWVTDTGSVNTVPLGQLSHEGSQTVTSDPGGEFYIGFDPRPTLIVAPNSAGRAELWLADGSTEGGSFTIRCALLHPRVNQPERPWRWKERAYEASAHIAGFAVGIGSRSGHDAASDLIGVTSLEGVFGLQKSNEGVLRRDFTASELSGSFRGSADPPILCSAGLIARTNMGIYVHSAPLGWSQDPGTASVRLPGNYRRRQGLAMLGRRVFVGHGTGVTAIDLEPRGSS